MTKEKIVKTREEKVQQMRDLRKEGYMNSHRISKMLEKGLIYTGKRDDLFQRMRDLAATSRNIDSVKLKCEEGSCVTYWYRSWDIAKILQRLEDHSTCSTSKLVGPQRESENMAHL